MKPLLLAATLAATTAITLNPIATADPVATAPIPMSPASQSNAVAKAKDYLEFSAFSRQGLIKQLEYDQFSEDDATYAVDNITVDWNEQATKKAKDYLNFSSFSQGSLIKQLEYDGFTPDQASHGVTAAGL